jgi:hypothetical protein
MWSLDEKELVAIHSLTQPARRWPDGERRSAGDRGGRSAGAQGETRQSSTTDAAHLLYRAGAQGETRQVRPRPRACAPGSPPGLFRPRVRVQAASVSPPGLSGVLKKIEFVFGAKNSAKCLQEHRRVVSCVLCWRVTVPQCSLFSSPFLPLPLLCGGHHRSDQHLPRHACNGHMMCRRCAARACRHAVFTVMMCRHVCACALLLSARVAFSMSRQTRVCLDVSHCKTRACVRVSASM